MRQLGLLFFVCRPLRIGPVFSTGPVPSCLLFSNICSCHCLALFRNLYSLPDVGNPDVLLELKRDPTIHAIFDAVAEQNEEIQAAEDSFGRDSARARTTGETSRDSYTIDLLDCLAVTEIVSCR